MIAVYVFRQVGFCSVGSFYVELAYAYERIIKKERNISASLFL
jgi:hypothetical protein